MRSILRTNGVHSCEEWNAFFARLKRLCLWIDFQALIDCIAFDVLYSRELWDGGRRRHTQFIA